MTKVWFKVRMSDGKNYQTAIVGVGMRDDETSRSAAFDAAGEKALRSCPDMLSVVSTSYLGTDGTVVFVD